MSKIGLLPFVFLCVFFYYNFANPYLYDFYSLKFKIGNVVLAIVSAALFIQLNPSMSSMVYVLLGVNLLSSLIALRFTQETFLSHNLNQVVHFFFILAIIIYLLSIFNGKACLICYHPLDNIYIFIGACLIHCTIWRFYTKIFKKQIRISHKYKIDKKNLAFTFFYIINILYVSDHFFNERSTNSAFHLKSKLTVIIISYLIFYVVSYMNYEHTNLLIYKSKHEMLEKKYQILNLKLEEQGRIARELRLYRHDLLNIMNVISENNLAEEEFIKTMIESPEIKEYLNQEISLSNHPFLDAYLYQFNKLCLNNDIDFQAQLIWETTMKDNDSLRLISNLLDNAYKACLNVEKGRNIKIESAIMDNSRLDVMISNTFNANNNYSKGSGLGLQTVRKIINENGGMFHYEKLDNQFIAYISLVNQH
ncbi:GHKL domain-containing protein [Erysipelothrix urinaevulpis]|uniref:GHKL domain-containing protein n=1 Tax=Erysipelothrix urinaevulpis TaxID=2683717 RepID=UPI001358B473|nr:GHKL domain-containing protein [Erysipelothrix urinaevulpis]